LSDTPAWTIPLADVSVDDELRRAADAAVSSGWWSMGPRVEALEEAFAASTGAAYAIAVSSGTAALHLALLAVGAGPGDEVLVASLNFVAAANTTLHAGATPVFCDIHGDHDLNVDPADLAAAVTPRTKAIIALHYGGHPCRMDEISALAERHGLAVIEDAAHAPGATLHGKQCGTLGAVGCFSFFANKNLPVGEGGMLVTDDAEIAARVRLLRSHGMTSLTWDRHRGHAHSYDVVTAGFNYRLDEVRAAIGLVQLARLDRENDARRRLIEAYREALGGNEAITIPFATPDEHVRPAHHLAVVVLESEAVRNQARAALRRAGIQTSVHYPPIHQFTHYRTLNERSLRRTDDVARRVLTLPLYGALHEQQVETVAAVLVGALGADRT
jgi:dTDP-4-amino-4,6-dideoxygalactose transaminase